jgi:hypothetical protein
MAEAFTPVVHDYDAHLVTLQNTLKGVVSKCILENKASLPFYQGLLKTVTDKRVAMRHAHALAQIHAEVHGVNP